MPKKETKKPTKQSKPVETLQMTPEAAESLTRVKTGEEFFDILKKSQPEPPVVTIQVTNTQDSQSQPLTPFTVLQRRQQREAEK